MLRFCSKAAMLIALTVFAIMPLAGCDQKENSDTVINGYLEAFYDCDAETAYQFLCEKDRSEITESDLSELLILHQTVYKNVEYEIKSSEPQENVRLGGFGYEEAVEYSVLIKSENQYSGQPLTVTVPSYVVRENNGWKVCESLDMGTMLSQIYYEIGHMYLEGKGKEQDYHQAIINFKSAIEADRGNAYPYYSLALAEFNLENYEDAMEPIAACIDISSNYDLESDAYNLKGLICLNLYDLSGARESFEQSLYYNADNPYAKDNMKLLE